MTRRLVENVRAAGERGRAPGTGTRWSFRLAAVGVGLLVLALATAGVYLLVGTFV